MCTAAYSPVHHSARPLQLQYIKNCCQNIFIFIIAFRKYRFNKLSSEASLNQPVLWFFTS